MYVIFFFKFIVFSYPRIFHGWITQGKLPNVEIPLVKSIRVFLLRGRLSRKIFLNKNIKKKEEKKNSSLLGKGGRGVQKVNHKLTFLFKQLLYYSGHLW